MLTYKNEIFSVLYQITSVKLHTIDTRVLRSLLCYSCRVVFVLLFFVHLIWNRGVSMTVFKCQNPNHLIKWYLLYLFQISMYY
jgi:hypothetical protein